MVVGGGSEGAGWSGGGRLTGEMPWQSGTKPAALLFQYNLPDFSSSPFSSCSGEFPV